MASPDGPQPTRVGFIGLGAMGFGMACNLLKKPSYRVQGHDVYAPSAERFVAQGGSAAESPREVAKTSDILVCMAVNAQQIDDILFNHQKGALQSEFLFWMVLVISCHQRAIPRSCQDAKLQPP